jgi:predicted metal-dependent HD superfamily phosphohydrolase
MNPPPADLKPRFTTWCLQHGASEAAAAHHWTQLSTLYTEPHRHYHHLGHIASSLAEFDATGSNNSLIEGAIWFHDVIYDPKRADNEVASTAWFLDATSSWLDPRSATAITRLIEATDFRLPLSDDPDSRLMVDIDLAILSASPDSYDDYCQAIRHEYAHVSDEAFPRRPGEGDGGIPRASDLPDGVVHRSGGAGAGEHCPGTRSPAGR